MRDLDIRVALHRDLLLEHKDEEDTLILDELGLCQGVSRIDVAVVNGAITGYEIKSPKDTLERLPQQQEVYSKTLDRVIIIAGESHVQHVTDIIPEWWGIDIPFIDGDSVGFYTERTPQNNPSVDPYSLVQLLWRDEALDVLTKLGLQRGVKSKPREAIWAKLAESLNTTELGRIVRERLKARRDWRSRL